MLQTIKAIVQRAMERAEAIIAQVMKPLPFRRLAFFLIFKILTIASIIAIMAMGGNRRLKIARISDAMANRLILGF